MSKSRLIYIAIAYDIIGKTSNIEHRIWFATRKVPTLATIESYVRTQHRGLTFRITKSMALRFQVQSRRIRKE